jgi:hypothetical protein
MQTIVTALNAYVDYVCIVDVFYKIARQDALYPSDFAECNRSDQVDQNYLGRT